MDRYEQADRRETMRESSSGDWVLYRDAEDEAQALRWKLRDALESAEVWRVEARRGHGEIATLPRRLHEVLAADPALHTAVVEVLHVNAENRQLRTDLLAIAHAVGVYYAADGVGDAPGPTPEIVAEIERLKASDDNLRETGDILSAHGCDCDCDHSAEEHDEECERCLGCRISVVISPT